jgi:hypothetical protein
VRTGASFRAESEAREGFLAIPFSTYVAPLPPSASAQEARFTALPAIQGQDPHRRPERSKKSPAPLFHAASQAVRRDLYAAYAWFVAAYRNASEKLRAGNLTVPFPLGSFPPPLPFVAG